MKHERKAESIYSLSFCHLRSSDQPAASGTGLNVIVRDWLPAAVVGSSAAAAVASFECPRLYHCGLASLVELWG